MITIFAISTELLNRLNTQERLNIRALSVFPSHAIKTSDERSKGEYKLFEQLIQDEKSRSELILCLLTEMITGINNSCPNHKEEIFKRLNDIIN